MYQEYQTNCPIFEETEKSDFHLQRLGKPNDLHSFFLCFVKKKRKNKNKKKKNKKVNIFFSDSAEGEPILQTTQENGA